MLVRCETSRGRFIYFYWSGHVAGLVKYRNRILQVHVGLKKNPEDKSVSLDSLVFTAYLQNQHT